MRWLFAVLIALMLAGCTTDAPEDDSVDEPSPENGADSTAETPAAVSSDTANATAAPGSDGSDGQGPNKCSDEVITETIWELPDDYDPTGDSGQLNVSVGPSWIKFRVTWSEVRSGDFAFQLFDGERLAWEQSGTGTHVRASPGAGAQSGQQYVDGELAVAWSAEGALEGLAVEAEYRPC